jgi:DNA-directed RNA polymerase specialized sigma24 family protein
MTPDETVTHWLGQFQDGDRRAAQQLWERYFHRLVGLARARLQAAPRRAADEEDVALSAFNSFFQGMEHGRFPRLDDRDDLWRVLVALTVRKAHHQVRDQGRQKRGGGAVRGESVMGRPGAADESGPGLEQFADTEPTPALAAEVAEECEQLLARLGDAELVQIALWKMEGDTNDEIASKLGCAPPTVERRLALIRRTWRGEGPHG